MKRALVSVTDKTGVVEFCKGLESLGYEIVSTGGTKKVLIAGGVKAIDISDVTGFPEILDGRVKTLHPMVHGGLLAVRDKESHVAQVKEHNIEGAKIVGLLNDRGDRYFKTVYSKEWVKEKFDMEI